MTDESQNSPLFDAVSTEYITSDGNVICGYDHDAMIREIIRLREIRSMVAEYMITPSDIGRIHLLRALMQPPEVAV